ncbi:hypothetical protein BpHYR1_042360, partial [Brachionus plicatilis]
MLADLDKIFFIFRSLLSTCIYGVFEVYWLVELNGTLFQSQIKQGSNITKFQKKRDDRFPYHPLGLKRDKLLLTLYSIFQGNYWNRRDIFLKKFISTDLTSGFL